jgi:MFS family permease
MPVEGKNDDAPAQRPLRDPDTPVTFDDALMRIGIGRGQYYSIATMCLLWMGEGMQMFICFYLPKAFYDEWGTPVDDVAWVDGSMFAGVFVGALIGGHCGDAYGRRPTLLGFTALSVVTGVLCFWTESFLYLICIRFLVGLGAGGFAPSSLSITLEACPSPHRGRVAIGVPGFAGAVGRVATAVLAEMLYDPEYNPGYSRIGWRGAMLMCCLPFLIALVLGLYVVSESARWMLVKGREREASEALHNLALKNGTEAEFPRGTKLVPEPDHQFGTSWVRISRVPLLSALVLGSVSHLCISVAYYGMLFALPVYLDSFGAMHDWTEQQKDLVLVIVALSEIPAIFIVMYMIEVSFIGRRYTVIGAMVGCAVFCFAFNFHLLSSALHTSYAVLVPNFFARGFAAAAMVTGNLYMAEIFPTGTRAAASSVSRASGQFGAAFAPITVGFLLVDYRQADLGMWSVQVQPRAHVPCAVVLPLPVC